MGAWRAQRRRCRQRASHRDSGEKRRNVARRMTRFDTKNTFIARPNVNVQQIFLISYSFHFPFALELRFVWRAPFAHCISFSFHLFRFISIKNNIVSSLLLCDLSSVSCLFLSWWHRSRRTKESRARSRHTQRQQTLFIPILLFDFHLSVWLFAAAARLLFSSCFYFFIFRISPEHRK